MREGERKRVSELENTSFKRNRELKRERRVCLREGGSENRKRESEINVC